MLMSINVVPLLHLEALKWRLLHQPRVIDHHVDAPELLHGYIDQVLHLLSAGDVRRHGECLAAALAQLVCQ
jgi:hypothetical protein